MISSSLHVQVLLMWSSFCVQVLLMWSSLHVHNLVSLCVGIPPTSRLYTAGDSPFGSTPCTQACCHFSATTKRLEPRPTTNKRVQQNMTLHEATKVHELKSSADYVTLILHF